MFDYTTYQVGDIPLFMYAMVCITTILITYATVIQSGDELETKSPAVPEPEPSPEQSPTPSSVGGKRKTKRNHSKRGVSSRLKHKARK